MAQRQHGFGRLGFDWSVVVEKGVVADHMLRRVVFLAGTSFAAAQMYRHAYLALQGRQHEQARMPGPGKMLV